MSILLDLAKNLAIQRVIGSFQKLIDSYFGGDDDRTDDFVSQQKPGGLGSILGRALAFAFLGPIAGPLAFSFGKGLLGRRNRINLTDDLVDDRGGVTATGMQFADVQDTLGSMDSGTDIDYNTGNITDKSTGEVTGNVYDEVAISTPSPAPAYDFDDSSSDSGSDSGGGSPGSSGPGGSDEMGSFRYGGLASLIR